MMEDNNGNLGQAKSQYTGKSAADQSAMAGISLLLFSVLGIGYGIWFIFDGGIYEYLWIACSLFLLIGSALAFRQAAFQRSIRVGLFERGLTVGVGEKTYCFAWDQIANVDETIVKKGRTNHWHVLLTRDDGQSFGFTEHLLDDSNELKEAIKEGTAAIGIPWKINREQ